jgi:hypothetical protein
MVLGEWPHKDRAVVMEGPVVVNDLYWYRLMPLGKSNATSVWSAWGTDPTEGPWFLTCADQPRFMQSNQTISNSTSMTIAIATSLSDVNVSSTVIADSATIHGVDDDDDADANGQAVLIGGIVAGVVLAIVLFVLFFVVAGKCRRSERDAGIVVSNEHFQPAEEVPLPRATHATVEEVDVDDSGTTLVAAETIDEPMPESNRYNELHLAPKNQYVSAAAPNASKKTPRYSVGPMSTFVDTNKK